MEHPQEDQVDSINRRDTAAVRPHDIGEATASGDKHQALVLAQMMALPEAVASVDIEWDRMVQHELDLARGK